MLSSTTVGFFRVSYRLNRSSAATRLATHPQCSTGSRTGGNGVFSRTRILFGPKHAPSKFDVMDAEIQRVRNIGIVAHIDAGKTTTTERMLFYAGVTKRVGDVDSGTTTTDYMPEEMERGITITSAAVSLQWKQHAINLIDTPGHVDFTVEVERALRVVDGVVALFDASAGVQAQSYTVLRQARKFRTPVIAFLNKMDKPNANFNKSVKSIQDKLQVEPLLVQLPLHAEDGAFEGVVDLVSMRALRFRGKNGSVVEEAACTTGNTDPQASSSCAVPLHVIESAQAARHDLLSRLTARDDLLSEKLIGALETTDGDEIAAEAALSQQDIHDAIRRQVVASSLLDPAASEKQLPMVPVLCGASRRDQGVQPLLDAVNAYLPSPLDRKNVTGFAQDGSVAPLPVPSNQPQAPTIALAFKVIHTANPGKNGAMEPLVFFTVYCGKVVPKIRMFNNSSHSNDDQKASSASASHVTSWQNAAQRRVEVIDKLFVMHANTPVEVPMISAGHIGAAFLRETNTGDTLTAEPQHAYLHSHGGAAAAAVSPAAKMPHADVFTLEGIQAPPPAISFAIEAANSRQMQYLDDALAMLLKEDPSLRVTKNDFGQVILSGMGELHLDIIMSRLSREHHVSCRLLRAIIEYREALMSEFTSKRIALVSNELPVAEVDLEWVPMVAADSGDLDALAGTTFRMTPECVASIEQSFGVTGGAGAAQGSSGGGTAKSAKQNEEMKAELQLVHDVFLEALVACTRMGPVAALPSIGIQLIMTRFHKKVLTLNHKTLAPAASQALGKIIKEHMGSKRFAIVEPMMAVEVHLTEPTYVGEVIQSLNEKNATTVDMLEDGRSVAAVVPMRNIVRYTMDLRKSAKGNANFFTKLSHYRVVEDKSTLARILKNLGVQTAA